MILKWDVKIPALTGEKTRKAYVYLPVGYGKDKTARYPVLYMFDGHNLLSRRHRNADYRRRRGVQP